MTGLAWSEVDPVAVGKEVRNVCSQLVLGRGLREQEKATQKGQGLSEHGEEIQKQINWPLKERG